MTQTKEEMYLNESISRSDLKIWLQHEYDPQLYALWSQQQMTQY